MKTIKNVKTEDVKRLKDVDADKHVKNGDWIYVPKSAMKSKEVKPKKKAKKTRSKKND